MTAVAPLPMTTTLLPVEVEAFGPGLGVHDGAGEVGHAGEVGQVPVVVAVVPAAGEEEGGGELEVSLVSVRSAVMRQSESGVDQSGRGDPVVEADVGIDAGFPGGVLDVLQYRVAVSDRLLAIPGPERVTQGVHVRVGTDAGIAEEVPGPSDGVAGLEDRVVGPGALGLEVVAGTDAGQSGAHDDHIEVGRTGPPTSSPSGCRSDQLVVQGAVLTEELRPPGFHQRDVVSLASGWKSEGWL